MQIWVIRIALFVSMIMAFTLSLDSKRKVFKKVLYPIIFIGNALIISSTI